MNNGVVRATHPDDDRLTTRNSCVRPRVQSLHLLLLLVLGPLSPIPIPCSASSWPHPFRRFPMSFPFLVCATSVDNYCCAPRPTNGHLSPPPPEKKGGGGGEGAGRQAATRIFHIQIHLPYSNLNDKILRRNGKTYILRATISGPNLKLGTAHLYRSRMRACVRAARV